MTCASATLVVFPIFKVIKMRPKIVVGELACFIRILLSLICSLSILQVPSLTQMVVGSVSKMASTGVALITAVDWISLDMGRLLSGGPL